MIVVILSHNFMSYSNIRCFHRVGKMCYSADFTVESQGNGVGCGMMFGRSKTSSVVSTKNDKKAPLIAIFLNLLLVRKVFS